MHARKPSVCHARAILIWYGEHGIVTKYYKTLQYLPDTRSVQYALLTSVCDVVERCRIIMMTQIHNTKRNITPVQNCASP
jgi:hypothetical protein